MKGIFQVQEAGPGLNLMAVVAFLHRQALAPDIAAVGKVVMAGGAGHTGSFVGLVPEKHRSLGARLELLALQGAQRFGHRGAQGFGAHQHEKSQG